LIAVHVYIIDYYVQFSHARQAVDIKPSFYMSSKNVSCISYIRRSTVSSLPFHCLLICHLLTYANYPAERTSTRMNADLREIHVYPRCVSQNGTLFIFVTLLSDFL